MKTYNQILKPEYCNKIFAHTSSNKNSETLIEHSEKTLKYCNHLIDTLSLKENFNGILSKLVPDTPTSDILELIRSIIYYHDLGKINPIFQKEKMRNDLCINIENLNSNHSFYGKILFDHLFFKDFYDKFHDTKCQILFFLLSQTIDRHHTALRDIDFLYKKMCANTISYNTIQKELDDLNTISHTFFIDCQDLPPVKNFCDAYNFKNKNKDDIRNVYDTEEKQESLFYLYKTVYSLLITSDYYATSDFIQNISYFDKISVITSDLVKRCEKNFYNYDFNKNLRTSKHSKNTIDSNISDIDDLNELRTRILLETDCELENAISNHPEQKVFYLNIPTGGGKTNISLKLALTLLKSKNNIKRVFYIFPFINIIEQNHDVIKKTFCLDKELSSIYSSSAWNVESEKDEERLQYVIDNEFLNHEFVVMSNVNFFNTFVKSGKTSNYRLVNLANSIVVIDEIQSLNDKDWTLFNDLIMYGSKYLNIYFIIMSATLPRLDALSDTKESDLALNLINSNRYSDLPLFKNRVSIQYRQNVNDLEQLLNVLNDELNDDMNKILLVVNTIQTSLELYKKIKKDKKISSMGFYPYLLNSTILPHRRKEIIGKMNASGKVILISTQSVEAGVDIDCDFGIRDFAIFDSIEQIAGRINRNSNNQKNTAKLIVTNLKEGQKQAASFIYADSHRWKTILGDDFNTPKLVQGFLEKRNFDDYYNKVLEHIKTRDNDMIKASSLGVVKKGIRHLDFEELNKVDVIKQDSISLIIDADVPKDEDNFTESELKFIQHKGQSCEKVSGRQIWKMYNEFLKNFQGGHIDKKINTKIWSSILSKFTVNIKNSHGSAKLSDILNFDNGIPLLKNEYYSNEEGIDRAQLDGKSFKIPT